MPLVEACFAIFYAPSKVFAEWKNRGWVGPWLIVSLIIVVLFVGTKSLMQPVFDAEIGRAMAKAQQAQHLTADQMVAGRGFAQTIAVVFGAIAIPIVVLLIGIVLWLVGRVVGSTQTIPAALMVGSFAYFPKILASLAAVVVVLVRDPAHLTGKYSVTLGPGFFLDANTTNPAILELVGRFDVFTLWTTVLLGIGLHVTGKVPKAQAYAAAAAVWVLGALPGLLGALRQ